MLNIEKYEEEIKKEIANFGDIPCIVKDLKDGGCGESRNCVTCSTEMLHWLSQEYKEPILTDKEKAYLKNVIEPKRDEIIYTKKTGVYKSLKADCCCVSVYLKNPFCNKDTIFVSASTPWTLLDFLTTKDMSFEGMVMNKRYTLEELGL